MLIGFCFNLWSWILFKPIYQGLSEFIWIFIHCSEVLMFVQPNNKAKPCGSALLCVLHYEYTKLFTKLGYISVLCSALDLSVCFHLEQV